MENSKIIKTRQFKKNEALNAIRKIYHPKYDFVYEQENPWGDWDDLPSCSEQRERKIRDIIENLEKELSSLKVRSEI